jgi:uncharacterized membrane protein YkvA (DUF1232 family)
MGKLRHWAGRLRNELSALYGAARDPRVPWFVRLLALAVVAYALSPIDLIPDFLPVIGYLDDLLIVPLGLWLLIRLMPADVLAEHRARARASARPPASRAAAFAVVAVWLVLAAVFIRWLANVWRL